MSVTIEAYYSYSVSINRHNKQYQDDLEIEQNLITKDWWKRVNTSMFGTVLFYSMNMNKACAGLEEIEDNPNEWFTYLVH